MLRGDIDAATVERLALHIQDVLEARTQFVTVDAAAVNSYDPDLLDLLGRTQHRLGSHRGMLQVRGLHPACCPRWRRRPRRGRWRVAAGSAPGPGASPMTWDSGPGDQWVWSDRPDHRAADWWGTGEGAWRPAAASSSPDRPIRTGRGPDPGLDIDRG